MSLLVALQLSQLVMQAAFNTMFLAANITLLSSSMYSSIAFDLQRQASRGGVELLSIYGPAPPAISERQGWRGTLGALLMSHR